MLPLPRSTLTDTCVPYTTLFLSSLHEFSGMSISLTQPSKMACRTLTLAALLFGRRGFPDVWLRKNSRRPSKRHLVAPFQLKDVPCLVGRGDLLAKSFYNLAHLGDLFCISCGELTRPDQQAVSTK